jgi:hypothetical protein
MTVQRHRGLTEQAAQAAVDQIIDALAENLRSRRPGPARPLRRRHQRPPGLRHGAGRGRRLIGTTSKSAFR